METLGTTTPIYVPRSSEPERPILPGNSYFYIKIHSAQAAFRGSVWDRVKRLIVSSKVSFNHSKLGNKPFKALRTYREVKKNYTEKLGLSPNLVSLIPATMTHVSVSLEYVLDKENLLYKLGNLINQETFISAVSLAPGAAAIAQTVGEISQKLVETFLEPKDREPILEFGGDFNIDGESLKDGYYIILGTRDPSNPLPIEAIRDPKNVEITNQQLLIRGEPAEGLSYVILEVRRVDARTRQLSNGAVWNERLREAEIIAENAANDPFIEDTGRRKAWEESSKLLKEAQMLLLTDENYLAREARDIISEAVVEIKGKLFTQERSLTGKPEATIATLEAQDFQYFELPEPAELDRRLQKYAVQRSQTAVMIAQEAMPQ